MGITKHYFVFDGVRSTDFGVWISGSGTYNAPARDLETVTIPGRNGDLHIDNGRYFNVEVVYPAFISKGFRDNVDAFRAFLSSRYGYCRLEDTYHPDEFRMAAFHNGFTATPTARNLAGAFDLSFDCKPQRYLKAGDVLTAVASGPTLHNPTGYTALPLIRVHGNGSMTVGDITVVVSGAGAYTDLDCDLQEAYQGDELRNDKITLTNGDFPELPAGDTRITFTGFSAVEIAPRWWTI
jgi:phage-related protein